MALWRHGSLPELPSNTQPPSFNCLLILEMQCSKLKVIKSCFGHMHNEKQCLLCKDLSFFSLGVDSLVQLLLHNDLSESLFVALPNRRLGVLIGHAALIKASCLHTQHPQHVAPRTVCSPGVCSSHTHTRHFCLITRSSQF